jgi:hypothetical protein
MALEIPRRLRIGKRHCHRQVGFIGDAHEHPAATFGLRACLYISQKMYQGFPTISPVHLDFPEIHLPFPAQRQGLEDGLLGRKGGGIIVRGVGRKPGILYLIL